MSGNIADKFTETFNGQNPTSTTVANPRAILGSTLVCQSLAGWPTNTAVHFATYQKDSTGAKIAGTQTDWKGIVSGSSINTLTREGGAADGGNGVGDIVEMMPTYSWAQDLATGLELIHNKDGSLQTGVITGSKIATGTVTSTNIADGTIATVDIADAAITNAKLATSTGEIGAAWQSYTPTWTNVTVGNATQSFRYIQVGKKVTFQGSIVLGSTSSVSGLIVLTVPVTMSSNASNTHINLGAGQFNRPAVAGYIATVIPINTTTIQFAIPNGVSDTRLSNADSTHPWSSWTTGDNIGFTITYEAA